MDFLIHLLSIFYQLPTRDRIASNLLTSFLKSTFLPRLAREADKLIDVVVFPTPPFWFATTIVLPIYPWNSLHSCKVDIPNPLSLLAMFHVKHFMLCHQRILVRFAAFLILPFSFVPVKDFRLIL